MPVDEEAVVGCKSFFYYPKEETILRTSDAKGQVRTNLAKQYSVESGKYRFAIYKDGFEVAVVEIAKKGFRGMISTDLVPAKTKPNQPPSNR